MQMIGEDMNKMKAGEFYINPNTLEIVQVLNEQYIGHDENDTGVRAKIIMSDRFMAIGGVCGISKDYYSYWKELKSE